MTWNKLITVLIPTVETVFGRLPARLLGKMFEKANPNQDVPQSDTLDGFRAFLAGLFRANARRLRWMPPSLKDLLVQMSDRTENGPFADLVWAGLSGNPLPAGVTVRPLAVAPEAAGAFFSVYGEEAVPV